MKPHVPPVASRGTPGGVKKNGARCQVALNLELQVIGIGPFRWLLSLLFIFFSNFAAFRVGF